MISFKNCTVTNNNTILFQPEWGIYDMAVGKEIVSAYAGPASTKSFKNLGKVSENKTHKITYSKVELELHKLYKKVSKMRNSDELNIEELSEIIDLLKLNYPLDWLLPLEIFELIHNSNTELEKDVLIYLN